MKRKKGSSSSRSFLQRSATKKKLPIECYYDMNFHPSKILNTQISNPGPAPDSGYPVLPFFFTEDHQLL